MWRRLLSAALIVPFIFILSTQQAEAAGPKMQQLDQFRAGVQLKNAAGETVLVGEGRSNDYDGYFGAQCMDLALFWSEYLGLPLLQASAAIYTWDLNPSGYQKIANGPTNIPEPGDILVFGAGMGPYGHIVIVLSADLNGFTSLDQNWYNSNETVGSPAAQVYHNYSAVLGWFHPIVPPTPAPVVKPPEQVLYSSDS